jgi:hypothetical protein
MSQSNSRADPAVMQGKDDQIAMLTASVQQLSQQVALLQQNQVQRPATGQGPFTFPPTPMASQHQALQSPAPFPMQLTPTATDPQSEIARCMLASQFMGMMSGFFAGR